MFHDRDRLPCENRLVDLESGRVDGDDPHVGRNLVTN